jgi:hypothetical protein
LEKQQGANEEVASRRFLAPTGISIAKQQDNAAANAVAFFFALAR